MAYLISVSIIEGLDLSWLAIVTDAQTASTVEIFNRKDFLEGRSRFTDVVECI